MLKAIAFGIATGAGVQAWRVWPADGPVTARAGILTLCVAVVCAYLAGRWHARGGNATAVATATAEATATASAQQAVQVAVIVPGHGAGSSVEGIRVPTEAVDWFSGQKRQIEEHELDGMDLSEFAEHDTETAR